MTRKKNKILTFCFSLIPGAGEMYMGFMKLGVSTMTLFFIFFGVASSINLLFLVNLCPVIWFYSFFNVHNINALSDEEFYAMEDYYLFNSYDRVKKQFSIFLKHRKLLSYILIFFGVSIIWNLCQNILEFFFYQYFSDELYYFFNRLTNTLPQTIIGIALVIIGIKLLQDKKSTLENKQDI